MADREKIKMGMIELMALRIGSMQDSVNKEDPSEFLMAREEYIKAKTVAGRFIDIVDYDKQFARLCEEYSRKHHGVML